MLRKDDFYNYFFHLQWAGYEDFLKDTAPNAFRKKNYVLKTESLRDGGTRASLVDESDDVCLFSAIVQRYPSMCGALMLHTFSYSDNLKPEALEQMINSIMKNTYFGVWGANKRWIIAMCTAEKYEPEDGKGPLDLVLNLPVNKEVEEMELEYPLLYEYFKKFRVCRTMQRFYNLNSNRIINMLEVIV